MTDQTEMLSCPFCGGQGVVEPHDNDTLCMITCEDCKASSGAFSSIVDATEAWNTRQESAKLPADDRALVEKAARAIHKKRQEYGYSGEAAWEYEPPQIHDLFLETARAAIAAVQSHTAAQNEKLREFRDAIKSQRDDARKHDCVVCVNIMNGFLATIEQLIKGE